MGKVLKYRVIHDNQAPEDTKSGFGMGIDLSAKEWLERAIDWADNDGDQSMVKCLEHMIEGLEKGEIADVEALSFIGEMWSIEFEETEKAEAEGFTIGEEEEPPAKLFSVEKIVLCGDTYGGTVDSGGDFLSELELVGSSEDRPVAYRVREFDEMGVEVNTEYYDIDYIDGKCYEERTLEKIKSDHPASEWQNNDW